MTLLRKYEPHELGKDGYPIAWHKPSEEIGWAGPKVANSYESTVIPAIKDYIRELAGNRCQRCFHPYPPGIAKIYPRGEWTPCDEQCSHEGPFRMEAFESGFGPVEAQWRILTVHHLNGDKADCRWWNLAALCQRCHLEIQAKVIMERVFPFEHTEWFKPYAAGWYAASYLDEDLTREQTLARLDELLALERAL